MSNGTMRAPVRDKDSLFQDVATQRQQNITRLERQLNPFRRAVAIYERLSIKVGAIAGEDQAEVNAINELVAIVNKARDDAQQAQDDLLGQINVLRTAMESAVHGGTPKPSMVLQKDPPEVLEALGELSKNDEAVAATVPKTSPAFTSLADIARDFDEEEDESQQK